MERYENKYSDYQVTISDSPAEILESSSSTEISKVSTNESIAYVASTQMGKVVACLGRISPKRVENYDDWIQMGRCLRQYGVAGLSLWNDWSRKSSKYRDGDCAAIWETITPEGEKSIEKLLEWAEEDSPFELKHAPKNPTPDDYRIALSQMHFTFQLNECNDDIIVNGMPMSDVLCATILYPLKNHGYRSKENAVIAWTNEAVKNRYHPIIEYLESLEWDGKDHLNRLCSHFRDKDDVFNIWMKRWLIGCVAKVMGNPKGQQNRMLVLDGKQDIGKSYFARWLCGPLPAYHIESPINPEDKDSFIRLMSKWIWEVSELGATTRKTDREALKNFLSLEKVTVRKSYGHYDSEKPALSNFIGTVNNEIGFLSDPTGSRRFMSCTLSNIDWDYSREVDVNQLWAQARKLFIAGEPWHLSTEEMEMSNQINKNYEVENPFIYYLNKYFDIEPQQIGWILQTAEIIEILKNENVGGMDGNTFQRIITAALTSLGLEKTQKRIHGSNPIRVWIGIRKKI